MTEEQYTIVAGVLKLASAVTCIAVSLFLLCPWIAYARLPSSLKSPINGRGPLSALRACLNEANAKNKTSTKGYELFSKNGQSFAMLNINFRPQVILPPEHVRWLVTQPEDILSHAKASDDTDALGYIWPLFDASALHSFAKVLQNDLTRNVAQTEQDVLREVQHIMDEIVGQTDSWEEVNMVQAFERIMYQATQRVYVGLPLCRDPTYMAYVKGYARSLGTAMVFAAQLTPWPLRRVTALLAGLPVYYYVLRVRSYLSPLFKERMERLKEKDRTKDNLLEGEPGDLITWMSNSVIAGVGPKSVSPSEMVTWLGILALLPTDNLWTTCTNVLLDLLSSESEHAYLDSIREEAKSVFASSKKSGQPMSHGLNRIDSAIRESLRMNSLSPRSLHRQVVRRGGVVLPDGQKVPTGTWLCVLSGNIQRDDDFYDDAQTYKPFRFVPKLAGAGSGKAPVLPLTNEKYLTFGHGRHACPGRWFSFQVMKIVIAYIIVNYDIQPLDKRPDNIVFADLNIPHLSHIIRIKRRN
ncbi:cytochrome P450 [Aspergillus nomiae NRRL 13137]|uniref:Cytochrome P450 n=1 Tax=Aspergillus nomiae NRRL (strain ATCC 15546 / NRRL 13137 / CBS 260.88 / M93) TaxID=1509407 RepID=A0A0L1JE64_ASPN3|nr:cytochrome P450 [Aspergillus nomiae NRRL 13137]KNG90080.1 cytochrome P450 [Aspergillus nomiae NRRL 13137]